MHLTLLLILSDTMQDRNQVSAKQCLKENCIVDDKGHKYEENMMNVQWQFCQNGGKSRKMLQYLIQI